MVVFTKHATEKFKVLKRHKFSIAERQVLAAVNNPDIINYSRLPLLIAQKKIDKNHVLRVVYKQTADDKKIITFYPGRSKQYL